MNNTIKLTNKPFQSLTAENGKNIPIGGYTFIPSVSSEGVISWTNDGDLENPTPVNIKGSKGDKGDRGLSGVYVGTGDMPSDCNVQIDPSGTTTEVDDLKNELSNISGAVLREEFEIVDVQIKPGWITMKGSLSTYGDTAGHVFVDVKRGERYKLSTVAGSNIRAYVYFDSTGAVIGYDPDATAVDRKTVEIQIPDGAVKVAVNTWDTNSSFEIFRLIHVADAEKVLLSNNENVNDAIMRIDNSIIENMKIENTSFVTGTGYRLNNGNLQKFNDTRISSTVFHVSEDTNFYVVGRGNQTSKMAISTNEDGTVYKCLERYPRNLVTGGSIEVKAGGKLYVSMLTSDLKSFELYKINKRGASRLFGKIAIFDGDSICAANSTDVTKIGLGWAGRIGKPNFMTWCNFGVGGGTLTSETYASDGSARHWVSTNIIKMHELYPDADYVILESCLNDGFNNIPIGELSTSYTDDFDPTTFSGAVEYLLQQAITLFPNSKIGVIIPHRVKSNLNAWHDFVRKACKKWSIPFIDLYYDSGICVNNQVQNTIMFSDGVTHLTNAGYDYIAPKIEAWMNSL